ncbi:MAG: prolipoprotein diacylglyceryl transferase [Chryseotalea sp. WA131a]|jgi:prolipoprotein diacylglyceryltransferase|nr:MAG: prolipoprotein diacylglyceryl transferase [Chryseotalea sp. WA131a]
MYTMLSYFIWNGSPEIFSIGFFSLRWYGLLFALGFLISQQLLYYIHKVEGKPEKDVETLTIIMIAATIIGARLGHVIFYQPEMLWKDPWGVFIPFGFSSIRFTEFSALALIGSSLPVLLFVWIYLQYKKSKHADIVGYVLVGLVLFFVAMKFLFNKPIGDFFPIELVNFRFTGFEGLASHGGAIAILFALWLYSRKNKPGQSYLQVLDRIVILVFLTGALIRLGNYFNSEIIGKPTDSPLGVLMVNPVTHQLMMKTANGPAPVSSIEYKKDTEKGVTANGKVGLNMYLFFNKGVSPDRVVSFLEAEVKSALLDQNEFIDEPIGSLNYKISQEPDGSFAAKVITTGIVRHPSQLYESISCFLLFLFFWWYWSRLKNALPEGRIFGWFMVILWSLRFVYEFLKKNQVSFEDAMDLNMGQLLSIPLVLVGVWVLVRSYRKPTANATS